MTGYSEAELRNLSPVDITHNFRAGFATALDQTSNLPHSSVSDKPRQLQTREVVFAAGAIESTRRLLLSYRQHDDRLFEPHGILGGYFYNHLSVPTSRVFARDARRLNQTTGFRFEGKTMRNLRFEPSFELRKQHALPTGFAHISFVSEIAERL